jgi:signal peptidase II
MLSLILRTSLIFFGILIIDQNIKILFVEGYRYYGECFSLVLAFNKGVAFSMFAFLQEWLKWIQIGLLFLVIWYIASFNDKRYIYPTAILLASGISNIIDRFIYGGVVDYAYWHCGFEFAIFNLADVLIDIAVVWMIIIHFKTPKVSPENK